MQKGEPGLERGRGRLRRLHLAQQRFRKRRYLGLKEGVWSLLNLHALLPLPLAADGVLRTTLRRAAVYAGLVQEDSVRSPYFQTDSLFTVTESRNKSW